MLKILFFTLIFLPLYTLAQNSWISKFPINTTFKLGESCKYEVSELFKIDNLLFGSRYEIESTVFFQVVDTAKGGYWVKYNVITNSVRQRKDSSAYILANLMDGINLYIYLKNGNLRLDTVSYFKAKQKAIANLDSIVSIQEFGKENKKFIQYLQTELRKDAGLGMLLTPLLVFETYYTSKEYKNFKNEYNGISHDVLNKSLFTGIVEQEWKNTTKDSTVTLNYLFTGDPVPAAEYHKSLFQPLMIANNIKHGKYFFPPEMRYVSHYTFRTQPNKSFPFYLFKKNVTEYIFRSVLKIEMKIM